MIESFNFERRMNRHRKLHGVAFKAIFTAVILIWLAMLSVIGIGVYAAIQAGPDGIVQYLGHLAKVFRDAAQ